VLGMKNDGVGNESSCASLGKGLLGGSCQGKLGA
jgi:hypothetical protein